MKAPAKQFDAGSANGMEQEPNLLPASSSLTRRLSLQKRPGRLSCVRPEASGGSSTTSSSRDQGHPEIRVRLPACLETGSEAMAAIRKWMTFHDHQRPDLILGSTPSAPVCRQGQIIKDPDQQVQRIASITPDIVQEANWCSQGWIGVQMAVPSGQCDAPDLRLLELLGGCRWPQGRRSSPAGCACRAPET